MKSLECQGPVTAVHFHKKKLYAGVGPYLKKYDWHSSALVSSTRVFSTNKIHGITSFEDQVMVWGGRSFAFSPDFQEYTTADWIISATMANNKIYLLTAHNSVYIYDNGQVTSKTYDHSILYSGTIFVDDHKVLVASGTVLHGILVWDLESGQLVHNFDQHKGSIFHVEFSKNAKYLASCSDDRCIIVWDLDLGEPVAMGWGHTSRIWKLKFSCDNSRIYSISEDLSCRVWEFSQAKELNCINTLLGHSGRNVWALDVVETPEPLICTGGQDGGIKIWTNYLLSRSERVLPIQQALEPQEGELYKGFCALGDTFVATTTTGRVVTETKGDWTTLGDLNVAEYSLVKCIGPYIFICSKIARVVVFDTEKSTHKTIDIPLGGNFSFCSGFYLGTEAHVLVQGHDPSGPILAVNLVTDTTLLIEPPLNQTVTSVCYFQDTLYVGTRTGALCFTQLGSVSWTKIDRILNSKDAITAIVSTDHLVIGSRSGSYGYFSADTLEQAYENKLQRGSIEGIQLQENGDILAYGFKKENLFITNLTNEYEVANEWCGGGHRTWSLTIDPRSESSYQICFVKASQLNFTSVTKPKEVPVNTVLRKKTHGREIRAAEFHPEFRDLVVTVSEDTTVAVSVVNDNFISVTATLRQHATPPQTLHWSRDGKLLGTAGAKEEMILWKISMGKYIKPCVVFPTLTDSPDLRVMDFDFLSMGDSESYQIACVYSDSTIRLWEYDGNNLKLCETGVYTDRCLLQSHYMVSPSNQVYLLVAATDGALLVYDNKLTQIAKYTVHQSGVTACTVETTPQGVQIYSGGEDNCLCGVKTDWDWNFGEIFKVKDAHASTITSIQLQDGYLYSTGPDQKICKWTLTGQREDSQRTAISDTGCLTTQSGRLLAAGMGACIYSI